MDNLRVARDMEQAGKDAKAIRLATDAVLDALDNAGVPVEVVSQEEAQRVLAEQNSRAEFAKSRKSSTFVPTSKVPKEELAVAHHALFAKVQDQAEAGTKYGVYSAIYFHIFNGSQHQYAIPIEGNEAIIDNVQNDIKNGTYRNAKSTGQWLDTIQSGQRHDSRNNTNAPRRRGGDVAVDALHGGQSTDSQRNSQQGNGDSRSASPLRTSNGVVFGFAKGGKIYLTE